MQESSYRLEAKGCHTGLRPLHLGERRSRRLNCESNHKSDPSHILFKCLTDIKTDFVEDRVCSDFGISQIFHKTARAFKFDIDRLTTDLNHSVEAGAIVLADFKKRYSKREVNYWTRYNSSSKSKRNIYKQLVERYF